MEFISICVKVLRENSASLKLFQLMKTPHIHPQECWKLILMYRIRQVFHLIELIENLTISLEDSGGNGDEMDEMNMPNPGTFL